MAYGEIAYDPFAVFPTPSLSSYRFFSSRAAAPDEVSTKLPSPAAKKVCQKLGARI